MSRPLYEIAREIRQDWKNVYFGARPYLDAMRDLDKISDSYGADSAKSVVNYFLANANAWRGETAKRVKAELKAMLKGTSLGYLDYKELPLSAFAPKQRVQLHPATDAWMQGDRYGTIVRIVTDGKKIYVKMDRSKRILIVSPKDLVIGSGLSGASIGANLSNFARQYLVTALWSSTDNKDLPMDKNYGLSDIAQEALDKLVGDADKFEEEQADVIDSAINKDSRLTWARAGHDFWLTQNGHGAGFGDEDWPEPEDSKLRQAAKKYKHRDLYVGDDGRIYV